MKVRILNTPDGNPATALIYCPHEFAGKTIPLPDIPVTEPWHPEYKGT